MLDKLLKNVNDVIELQSYAEAQYNTIVKLSTENKNLKEEVTHLKKLLESTTPLIQQNTTVERLIVSDEEAIAKIQLEKIRDLSLSRELTLEEAKRFEIFYKVLSSVRNTPKTIRSDIKQLDEGQLLALIEDKSDVKE